MWGLRMIGVGPDGSVSSEGQSSGKLSADVNNFMLALCMFMGIKLTWSSKPFVADAKDSLLSPSASSECLQGQMCMRGFNLSGSLVIMAGCVHAQRHKGNREQRVGACRHQAAALQAVLQCGGAPGRQPADPPGRLGGVCGALPIC